MKMTKSLAALAALTPLVTFAAEKEDKRMNIIHIMSDDHSYQTISAYGGPVSKLAPTPNIDRLAARGMTFTRAYVENSISTPSRAALITGKYSHKNGQIKLGGNTFDPRQPNFAEILRRSGYQTAVVGKWHLNGEPYGFDYYKVLNDQGTYYSPAFRTPETEGRYVKQDKYVTHAINDAAMEWLDKRDRSKPFCLLVHHKSVHREWFPETKYVSLYNDVTFPEPATLFDDYRGRQAAAGTEMTIADDMTLVNDLKADPVARTKNVPRANFDREYQRMTAAEQRVWQAAYGPVNESFMTANLQGRDLTRWKYQRYMQDYLRCVKSLDDAVGELLDYLDANGLAGNTMVVYCSDQGFYMGEHGWFDKRFMYEESFRTPLIVSWPGVTKPGSKCDELVQNIDFAPTYLAAGKAKVPADMDGMPLQPLLKKKGNAPKNWRTDLYYHYYDYPAVHNVRRHDGLATKEYKIIHFADGGGGRKGKDLPIDAWEFYDLRKDPQELTNQIDNPKYAAIVAEMKQRLEARRVALKVDDSKWDLEGWRNKAGRDE